MAKEEFQGIVPNKRSIRNLSVERGKGKSERRGERGNAESAQTDADSPQMNAGAVAPPKTRMPKSAKWGIWVFTAVVLAVLAFTFSLFFSGVTVTVVPKQETAFIDGEFSATRAESEGALAYEVMSLTHDGEVTVDAGAREAVERRAQGTIVIYNDYNSAPQRLIPNTRFETPDGLVYRVPETVTVPGQTQNEAGETVPGSIEAVVYADQPGEEYNIDRTDFTVPGFSGTERFDYFYARSKTEMTGGFSGEQMVVEEGAREEALGRLEEQLRAEVLGRAASEKPDGHHLFEGAAHVSFRELAQEERGSGQVALRGEVELHAPLFAEGALAELVARNALAGYEGGPVRLARPDALTFAPIQPDAYLPHTEDSFDFRLHGETDVIWEYDSEAFARDLAGKSEEALSTVLSGYPAVDHVAHAAIRPFWRGTFPDDPSEIFIKEELE